MPRLPKKQIVFLLNPQAGARKAGAIRTLAPAILRTGGFSARFVEPASARAVGPECRKAMKAGAWAIVAVGGDGTVNAMAHALAGTACRLGVVPQGTGNGFARALGIPLDMRGALETLAQGHWRAVDHAKVGSNRSFANIMGLGFDAWVAKAADELRWVNRIHGFLRYLLAGLQSLPHFLPVESHVRVDGRSLHGRFQLLAIANSPQYGFNCTIAPRALMDDGLLDVVCLRSTGPLDFIRNFFRLFKKKPLIGATYLRGRKISISSDAPLPCHMDGEPGGWAPLVVQVRHRALKVIVPA